MLSVKIGLRLEKYSFTILNALFFENMLGWLLFSYLSFIYALIIFEKISEVFKIF